MAPQQTTASGVMTRSKSSQTGRTGKRTRVHSASGPTKTQQSPGEGHHEARKDTSQANSPVSLWEEFWWHKPLVEVPQVLTWTATGSKGEGDGGDDASADKPRRLSLRGGADSGAIREYVKWLSNHLANRVLGRESSWVPFTEELHAHYSVLETLGRGHYGAVSLCEDIETGERLACKTILKSSIRTLAEVNELCAEILIPLRLQEDLKHSSRGPPHTHHPGLVRLHDIIDDDEAVHLIMEHCNGGDLFDSVVSGGRLSERRAAHVIRETALAVMRMHRLGVVHRDLKPENILLTRPDPEDQRDSSHPDDHLPGVKVADFGLCKELDMGEKTTGATGSLYYMAPEVVQGQAYGHQVDVWSLGVVLYTCLSGRLPFCGEDQASTFGAIVRAQPRFRKKPWAKVSYEAKMLVLQMLNPDPEKRISIEEVLTHEWVLRNCCTQPSTQALTKHYGRIRCIMSPHLPETDSNQ